jgi:hypothetical protein
MSAAVFFINLIDFMFISIILTGKPRDPKHKLSKNDHKK